MDRKLLQRLTKYRRVLNQLKDLGLDRVFSNNLGDALDITSALVRKDFSVLGIPGNRRGGYTIDEVMEKFDKFLGKDKYIDVVVVGYGNIGKALLKYSQFPRDGIRILAGFDVDPIKIHRDSPIPILPIDELESFVKEQNIKLGVISVPSSEVKAVFQKMIKAGIRGFLNFSTVELKCNAFQSGMDKCPKTCTVHNMNITPELENLHYMVSMKEKMDVNE